MKDIMHLHAGRNFELISTCANPFENFKRTEISMHQLFAAFKFQAQILRMQKHKITGFVGDVSAFGIGIMRHVVLSGLEALLSAAERVLNFQSLGGRRSSSHRHTNVSRSHRMSAVIEEKWSGTNGSLIGVVDGKFDQGK
jgi:hypothetical protein